MIIVIFELTTDDNRLFSSKKKKKCAKIIIKITIMIPSEIKIIIKIDKFG